MRGFAPVKRHACIECAADLSGWGAGPRAPTPFLFFPVVCSGDTLRVRSRFVRFPGSLCDSFGIVVSLSGIGCILGVFAFYALSNCEHIAAHGPALYFLHEIKMDCSVVLE